MKKIDNQEFGGERPLYKSDDLDLRNVTIHLGESSLKKCTNINAIDCRFEGKYVFWETDGIRCERCYFAPSARSSVWYSKNILITDCLIDAPKIFRRTSEISCENVQMTNAEETFWDCKGIKLKDVQINNADYLFMHSEQIEITDYKQNGNYSFQYAKDVVIRNAVINSKDSFWDSENCTLIDCEINGEYLAWYSRNLRLIRCHITGTQPLCYCQDLYMEDCTMGQDADLAFEYSTIEATIKGKVHSIKNPTSGHIKAEEVGEIIIDKNQKKPADCKISYDRICKS